MLGFQFAARLMGRDSGDENLKDTFHFQFVLLLHIGASVGFGIHKNKDVFKHGSYPLIHVCLFVCALRAVHHSYIVKGNLLMSSNIFEYFPWN